MKTDAVFLWAASPCWLRQPWRRRGCQHVGHAGGGVWGRKAPCTEHCQASHSGLCLSLGHWYYFFVYFFYLVPKRKPRTASIFFFFFFYSPLLVFGEKRTETNCNVWELAKISIHHEWWHLPERELVNIFFFLPARACLFFLVQSALLCSWENVVQVLCFHTWQGAGCCFTAWIKKGVSNTINTFIKQVWSLLPWIFSANIVLAQDLGEAVAGPWESALWSL